MRGSLYRNQREFYLQEQLKAIHRELGQEDHDDLDGLAEQIAAKGFPEAARARAERELRKLRRTPPMSPGVDGRAELRRLDAGAAVDGADG